MIYPLMFFLKHGQYVSSMQNKFLYSVSISLVFIPSDFLLKFPASPPSHGFFLNFFSQPSQLKKQTKINRYTGGGVTFWISSDFIIDTKGLISYAS